MIQIKLFKHTDRSLEEDINGWLRENARIRIRAFHFAMAPTQKTGGTYNRYTVHGAFYGVMVEYETTGEQE